MPRRGGLTSTRSGTASRPVAKAVESSAAKLTFSSPSISADRCAQAIASALISMPVSCICGVAQCRPKPPTPQKRSHMLPMRSSPTQSRAAA